MSLDSFLSYFPIIEPSFTIAEESIDAFRQNNDYLPERLVQDWIYTIEGEEGDEFTEYFPCLRLPSEEKYQAIVYWKASLLRYEYIMATLDHKGNLISRKVIAGMIVNGQVMIKSVAHIDVDLIIHIMTGSFLDDASIDTDDNLSFALELSPDGQIISGVQDA